MKHDISDITLRGILLFLPLFAGLLGITASGGGGGGGESPTTGNNPSVAAKTSTIPRGDTDCPNGGILVETGIDENRNGVLDADEVDASEKVCNGADGAQGPAGSDGLNALVVIEDEPAGPNCASGGKRIRSGLDANGDGMLDAAEVASDDYICNGETGAQGPAGSDGHNALIDMNPEPVGANCPMGGLRIDVGIDSNGNGSLDPNEITQTGFACNGGDGGIGWQVATLLEKDNAGDASHPQVAVWYQRDGTRTNIYSNRYVPGRGWGSAQLIETNDTGSAVFPQVAVDASGNAVAVWRQFDGTRDNIWANRYVPGTGWGTAELIETDDTGDAGNPKVAVDASGNAVAVWRQPVDLLSNIWSNRYIPGFGWGTAQLIQTDNAGGAYAPQVAVDGSGNAVAVWSQLNGGLHSIYANRYVPGTGWGTAQLIETDDTWHAGSPQVAVDGSGNAVAVWQQSDGTRDNIWANRYVLGTGWGTAEIIETDDTGDAGRPQVAVDASGNAVAVWEQWDGSRFNIWSNRYVPGTGWGTAELIETDNAGFANFPQVAVDGSGNAVAVWAQWDGTNYSIWSNRYIPGFGWGTAQLIETDNAGFANNPQVAVDGSGNAVAVWYQSDGTRFNIWSNRWQAP